MKTKTLVPFLTLSFGLTWGIAALLILFYDQVVAIFGEITITNPLFIAISVILTPLFNAARGSLLIAALYHFQMMNPAFPDAQPWDILMFVIAAVVIVGLNRRKMFQRGGGITDVLMPGESGDFSRLRIGPEASVPVIEAHP